MIITSDVYICVYASVCVCVCASTSRNILHGAYIKFEDHI